MVFRSLRLNTVVRAIALSVTIMVEAWVLAGTSLYVTAGLLAVLVVVQVVSMIRYVEKTNEELTRFFRSVRYGDFSSTFSPRGEGKS